MGRPRLAVYGFTVGALVAACSSEAGGTGGTAAVLSRLRPVTKQCQPDRKVAAYGATDLSGTGRGDELVAGRTAALRDLVARTAVCSGHIRIVAFSGSVTETVILVDRGLEPSGATEAARLLSANKLITGVEKAIEKLLPAAEKQLSPAATDVLSQFGAAREYGEQLGSTYRLDVVIASDGLTTTGAYITNIANFTEAVANDAGRRVPMPDLSGATVTVTGVGRVAGVSQPPTAYVVALKIFYETACGRTHARCIVVTDYTARS
jgi:hypothetical protein